MTEKQGDTEGNINRRTVLKSTAAMSAAGLIGVPAISGGVAADSSLAYQFYAVHPYNRTTSDGKRYLVGFDPSSGNIAADAVELSYDGGGVPSGTMVTASFSPDGTLYTVIAAGGEGQVATIDPDDGTVENLGSSTPDLYGVPGSGILADGHLYALHKPTNNLRKINLGTGSIVDSNSLTIDDSWDGETAGTDLLSVYGGDYHVGLAVDFANDELLGVIGNGSDPYGDSTDDELVSISTDGTAHLIEDDVISELSLIGVEVDPCSGKLYAMRGGSNLWQVDKTGENSTDVADVTLGGSPVTVASLASPYPESVCCDPCPEGFYYKFEWVEDEEAEGDCAGEFVIYDSEDNMVEEVDGLSLVSVECDEDGEPVEACFETGYCGLSYEVKAGDEEEEHTFEYVDEYDAEFCVMGIDEEKETGRGTKTITYAISNIEFYCN